MRRSLSLMAGAATAMILLSAGPAVASAEPVPIPGGMDIPPLIHVFAPGPTDQGFMGLDVEPTTITNFHGFTALAYISGTATDGDGNTLNITLSDMRVFRGTYVAADGSVHFGTFAFI